MTVCFQSYRYILELVQTDPEMKGCLYSNSSAVLLVDSLSQLEQYYF